MTARPTPGWRGLKLLGGGGALIDGGAHYADMMLHVFGPVAEVYCQMRTFDTPLLNGPAGLGKQPLDVEDTWLATLHFESGLVGHWSWSRQAWGHKVTSGVYWGSKGSFQDRQQWMHAFQFGADLCLKDGTEIPYEELEQRYFAKLSQKQRDQLFPFGFDDGITNECWDFVEACTRGRAPEVDGEAGLQAKSLCYAFYESNLAGKPVRPADVASGKVNAYQKPIDAYCTSRRLRASEGELAVRGSHADLARVDPPGAAAYNDRTPIALIRPCLLQE